MSDRRPTWELVLEGAKDAIARGASEFGRAELIAYVQEIDPSRARSSIDPIIQGMTDNASGGPASACGLIFHRIDRGRYELIEPAGTPALPRPSISPRRLRPSSRKRARVESRLAEMAAGFDGFVDRYDVMVPFVRDGQYELHRATIDYRAQFRYVADALLDDGFVDLVHKTLKAWGIGKRASRLQPLGAFATALRDETAAFSELESLRLEELTESDAESIGKKIWDLIESLRVVDNIARIVAGTKTLHHLLPELVPPMDRAWTGRFFEWNPVDLQVNQRSTFVGAFSDLAGVATSVHPSRLVGPGWRTSPTKVIDNAVVAYTMR